MKLILKEIQPLTSQNVIDENSSIKLQLNSKTNITHSRFFTLTLTEETTDQKIFFFLLCRVKNVTSQAS
jgi:hypothetical protein